MRQAKAKNKTPFRQRSHSYSNSEYTPGFPIMVEEHPIAHQISRVTYKVLSRLVLTIRPLVQHFS